MVRSREFYEHALSLYVEDGKALSEISSILGVPYSTLARWSRQGRWSERRQVKRTSSRTLFEHITKVLTDKVEEMAALPPSAIDVALIRELKGLTDVYARLRDEYRPFEVVVLAFQLFVPFVRKQVQNETLLREILAIVNSFISDMEQGKYDNVKEGLNR